MILVESSIRATLRERYEDRLNALAEQWEDEATAAAMNGNPRRCDYLEYMAARLRSLAATVVG